MGYLDAYSAAAIQAAGAIGSNIVSGHNASKENRKAREWNEKMYYQQVEDNRKNWLMQQEYNLPSAQVQRLLDAGLSPALMYSNGTGSIVADSAALGGHSAGSPANFAHVQNPFGDLANTIAVMRKASAETDLLKSQAEKNRQDVEESKERTFGYNIENEINWSLRDARIAMGHKNLEKVGYEIEWLATQENCLDNMTAKQLDELQSLIDYRRESLDQRWEEIENNFWYQVESIALGNRQVDATLESVAVAFYNARTERMKINKEIQVFDAQIKEINARTDLTVAQKNDKYLEAYNRLVKTCNLEMLGVEELPGTIASSLLCTGVLSGRLSDENGAAPMVLSRRYRRAPSVKPVKRDRSSGYSVHDMYESGY